MLKSKKSILLIISLLLATTVSVFGTLAYLSDSHTMVNTFTVGNVDIDLDEAEVNPDGTVTTNPDGTPTDNRIDDGNEYHLLPGCSYVKDPTVTVNAGSEESYVRMLVTLNKLQELKAIECLGGENFLPENFVSGWDREVWIPYAIEEDTENNTVTYEFRYYQTVSTVDSEEDLVLPALFTSIEVPGEITGDELATIADLEITVHGHAIQTASFDNADAAWAAFDAQVGE